MGIARVCRSGARISRRVRICCLWLSLFSLFQAVSFAHAEPTRRAFVVGIGKYDDKTLRLNGPKNDARQIAKQLSKFAFTNVDLIDDDSAKFKQVEKRWAAFVKTVNSGDTVVVYFSGHGVTRGDANFILARDFLTSDMAVDADASSSKLKLFSVEKWRADLASKKTAISIWILDACRDNGIGLETHGLRTMDVLAGNVVMYSASAGETSTDASEETQLSLYTKHLLEALKQFSRADVVFVARTVQSAVAKAQNDQMPELVYSMRDYWCFNICDPYKAPQLKLDTLEASYEASSKLAFVKSKSIPSSERRRNAVFIGTQTLARLCDPKVNSDSFDCLVLKEISFGNFSQYIRDGLVPIKNVSVYWRPPIVKDPSKYMCKVGSINSGATIPVSGILSIKYRDETFYWATLKSAHENCVSS